jgi:ABC-2 type transport system permease protein
MKLLFTNLIAIYRRELQTYFLTPWGYLIAALFWLVSGFFFAIIYFNLVGQGAEFGTNPAAPAIDYAYELIRTFLRVLGQISLFILPILSRSLYAEERKRGTLELLATSPVTNWAVAVAKLAAVVTYFATILLPILLYQVFALQRTAPPITLIPLFWGYLGLVLLSASVLSLGMFISSLTDSTIIAAIATFGLVLILSLVDAVAVNTTGVLTDILSHISLLRHYETLVQGVMDSSAIAAFATYIFLGIFLTSQSIEAFRFQRS